MFIAISVGILLVLFNIYVVYAYFFQNDEEKSRKFSSIVESFKVTRIILFIILGIGLLGFIKMIVDFIKLFM